ncbi:MAG TPA: DUF4203 domain-containing protein [Candidatus Limiplasma sp.]|nr:DUF4203 domain-containing protein [Candidatus Limiplasma sp.]HRX07601.1 DUF4203 domain-containing protein [Candidatus Limiplasma sp.]
MTIAIVAILIGLLMCFFGYRLFRVWLFVAGLFLGAYLGYYLGRQIGGDVWPIVGAAVIGIALAALAYWLYKVGAVLIGALLGASLVLVVLNSLGVDPVWWTAAIGAVAGALIAGLFIKEFIIVGSALNGATMATVGVYALITGKDYLAEQSKELLTFPWYILVIVAVVTVIAAIGQFRYVKVDHEL